MTNVNRPLFKPGAEDVLVRGLNAMSAANEALVIQNKVLNADVEALKAKVARLQEKLLENLTDKE